jgi:hypothetical protein
LVARFNPPDEGLKPEENVVWVRKRGTSFWVIFFGMMLGIGGLVCTIIALVFFGLALALPLLILIGIGFFFILRGFIKGRDTKYYITNERLIETKKGDIAKEIPLERFQGKPVSQFIDKKVTGVFNGRPVYVFRIFDPQSGETLMEFKDLDGDSVELLESRVQIVECRYCGFKNPANSLKCKNCGAPL